jgi:hypothetical protein
MGLVEQAVGIRLGPLQSNWIVNPPSSRLIGGGGEVIRISEARGNAKRQRRRIYSSTEDSLVVPIFERNNEGLKILSSFIWTGK